jgi:hypothetical protein
LTQENETYLINLIAGIINTEREIIDRYFNELKENEKLKKTIISYLQQSVFKMKKDKRCDYGSRLAFYAIIRAVKPKLVVENGVEVGFTSVVLCEAIRKNIEEGYEGKFIGLDINKEAGDLIKSGSPYRTFAEIKFGDAIASLNLLEEKIDFYFSDGLRTYAYEQNEFANLRQKLNDQSIVITNKATFSKALYELSVELKRKFSFFKEHPQGHWYEGSGIGIMHS